MLYCAVFLSFASAMRPIHVGAYGHLSIQRLTETLMKSLSNATQCTFCIEMMHAMKVFKSISSASDKMK
jgi:hypothetical protein